MKIVMFVLSDDPVRHLLYCICWFTVFVQSRFYDDAGASYMSWSYSLKCWRMRCCLYPAIFESYYLSIYAMDSMELAVEE
jgi:hypothetical protein